MQCEAPTSPNGTLVHSESRYVSGAAEGTLCREGGVVLQASSDDFTDGAAESDGASTFGERGVRELLFSGQQRSADRQGTATRRPLSPQQVR